jgi:hypothetical protein
MKNQWADQMYFQNSFRIWKFPYKEICINKDILIYRINDHVHLKDKIYLFWNILNRIKQLDN